jgi:hypothetical protein
MRFGISACQCIQASDIRWLAIPGLAMISWFCRIAVFRVRRAQAMQLKPLAEILPVCRLGDEPGSAYAEWSQGVLACRIDVEHFLKIENVAVAMVCTSSYTKEFLCPQTGQPALEDECPGTARRWQCNSQHACIYCNPYANRQWRGDLLNRKQIAKSAKYIRTYKGCRSCGNAAKAAPDRGGKSIVRIWR